MVSKCFRRPRCRVRWRLELYWLPAESPMQKMGLKTKAEKALKVGCPKVEDTCARTSFLALGDVREREMLKSFKYSFLIDQEKVVEL